MNPVVNISFVVPVYGCAPCLEKLCHRTIAFMNDWEPNFEIILINDSSPDDAWNAVIKLSRMDSRIKGLNLARNFGQHYAINAGLQHATGEWVVVLDCDLQDQPEEVKKLYDKAMEGYDVVLARRVSRQDSFLKKMSSKLFYYVLGYMTETSQDSAVANFGIYHKKVVRAILDMKDQIKYLPTMVKWVGFKQVGVEVIHSEREEGKTSYNFKKLVKLALNITLSFSDKPLRLTMKFGLLMSLFSLLFAFYNLIKYLNGDITVTGWTSLIISIWFLSGVIIFVIGFVGLYIGKIFEQVKGRPVFIIKDKLNL